MGKIIVFDADEVVVKRKVYFNFRLERDYGIPVEKTAPFFQNEYKSCAVGKADLKEELEKHIDAWGWKGTVEELLEFWFESERELDEELIKEIKSLRAKGHVCCLATNNEIYRTKYLIQDVGLGGYFDYVFSSAEIGHLKSENEFWKYVMQKMNISKPDKITVWDSDQKIADKTNELGMKGFRYKDINFFRENTNA